MDGVSSGYGRDSVGGVRVVGVVTASRTSKGSRKQRDLHRAISARGNSDSKVNGDSLWS
jgi:hypothetical protein